ncbi:hypothetical protein [uncultured Bacteroides sp.]|uniref:hypothetical protein n=1 Tax=uncultured Bacteroides sp. TaxID=162156 RepID=UPI00266F8A2C|nr:hypothetical protein [uncultured Bacteroides sp.]
MKRTTYVIIGMLVAGLAVICGAIFYASCHMVGRESADAVEIGGERKTVELPECRVVKLLHSSIVREEHKRTVREPDRISYSLCQVPLSVSPADSGQGSFSYAGDMDEFLSLSLVGDTLLVSFDFSRKADLHSFAFVKIKSEQMELKIPSTVQTVLVDVDAAAAFCDFRRDSLAFHTRGVASVRNCRMNSLSARAVELKFVSGEVRDLHIDLDEVHAWQVVADSFHIDTEHLSGSREHWNSLQVGECRQVLWTPVGEEASLHLNLKQAAKLEIGEQP